MALLALGCGTLKACVSGVYAAEIGSQQERSAVLLLLSDNIECAIFPAAVLALSAEESLGDILVIISGKGFLACTANLPTG